MKKLIDVILLIADKYMDDVNLIIADRYLTLEYLTMRGEEKDVYKSMKIEAFEDSLKIYIYGDKIERIVDIEGLEAIIKILEKQSKARPYTKEEIKYIRQKYAPNTKIELIQMYDLVNPVPPYTTMQST